MSQTPDLLVISDRHQVRGELVDVLEVSAVGGADTIYLRERDLTPPDRQFLLVQLLGRQANKSVTVLTPPPTHPGASGVHLGAADHYVPQACSRSVHSVDATRAANEEPLRFVIAAPVFASRSKPGRRAIGIGELAEIAAASRHPVVALGGIAPNTGRVSQCVAAGATGVATMGAVMRAADPLAVVRTLHSELTRAKTTTGVAR